MRAYVTILHQDPGSDIGVSFPDLPGCISAGRTLEEALAMAAEALALHLDGLEEEGDPIRTPSSPERIAEDPENRSGVAILVRAADHRP